MSATSLNLHIYLYIVRLYRLFPTQSYLLELALYFYLEVIGKVTLTAIYLKVSWYLL